MRDTWSICGTFAHAPDRHHLEILNNAIVDVDAAGKISAVHKRTDADYTDLKHHRVADGRLLDMKSDRIILPGFVDLHVHAPQWPQIGKALDRPLAEWLEDSTFPLEAKYSDSKFAAKVYSSLVDNLLANGTTTAMYYATIHLSTSKLLADICHGKGQRALVGKVAMDNVDQCPTYYRDNSTEQGLSETAELIEYVRDLSRAEPDMLLPVITPRFIPSCTDEMLRGLGRLSNQVDCHIQTHCSESDWEHNYVIERFGKTDATCLEEFGLLTEKTVLAHANHISANDARRIVGAQSGIAHCPLSNFYFSDAVFPARRMLDHGLRVGLGSDIAGGSSPSLLRNCHMAVTASRALECGVDARWDATHRGQPGARISFNEAFWMATRGGGEILGLNIGKFEKDYAFDAISVKMDRSGSNLISWPGHDSDEDLLQKILCNADRGDIDHVWVNGKRVVNR